MMLGRFFLTTALISNFVWANCPPPMVGAVVTTVRYIPAENISKFDDNFEAHFSFLTQQMQAGTIEYAGPFLRNGNEISGGFSVYRSNDLAKVESLVSQDAFIKAKVFTCEMNSWMMCSLPKP